MLISKGADVSIKEENEGNTPLNWAMSNTDPKLQAEIVMVLLMNGADANARNNNKIPRFIRFIRREQLKVLEI